MNGGIDEATTTLEDGREQSEAPAVSSLELFSDLVFVFAITQLTTVLVEDRTWTGVVHVLLLFGMIWWIYGGYIWLTNAVRPDRLVGIGMSYVRWGASPAGAYAAGAARDPGRLAVIDEREEVSYGDIDRRSTAVAHALKQRGVETGDAVALLARNSAAFVVAQVAISKLGADVLYLNTGFAGPQLGDVLKREKAAAIIADQEFAPHVDQLTMASSAPVQADADGKYPVPEPGRKGKREY